MSNKPVITLSTSYFWRRISDGYELMCKAAEMGFEYVELGHSTSVSQIEGIMKALDEGVIKVASVHNFCPIPPFASGPCPNLFSPEKKSASESLQWSRHTLNTLNFASSVGAKRMVMHSGEMDFWFFSPVPKMSAAWAEIVRFKTERADLIAYAKNNPERDFSRDFMRLDSDFRKAIFDYERIRASFIKRAYSRAEKFHDRIFENIAKMNPNFAACGITIGVENRDGFAELPFDTRFAEFARRLMMLSNARAWIDIGHAQIKHLSGIIDMRRFLESTRGLVCGWHLHDCSEMGKDHQGIVGKGSIDFNLVKNFFDVNSQIFTLEINSRVSEEDVVESRKRVEDMF